MFRKIMIILFFICCFYSNVFSQKAEKDDLLRGINFIKTQVYTDEENAEILELFKGLRVADVADGLDKVGLPETGLVDQSIHSAWLDLENFSHRICGIALTVRYVPTQKQNHPGENMDFDKWVGEFYSNYSSEPFKSIIKTGSVIVIDDAEDRDIGSIGSNNILGWYSAGAVGVITDAGSRDTDEIAKEKVPLYLKQKGRGIRPGRNEVESVNRPVVIGGVLVCPGDIIVADGDGVVVVPRKVAKKVALYARATIEKDKKGRRALYKKLGIPLDNTVK